MVPKWMSEAVEELSTPLQNKIVGRYVDEERRRRRIKKAIHELRSFQCESILTKKQLKEVVLILKDAKITEDDFWHMDEGNVKDEIYDGWFWKIRQAKEDKNSGLFEYFKSIGEKEDA